MQNFVDFRSPFTRPRYSGWSANAFLLRAMMPSYACPVLSTMPAVAANAEEDNLVLQPGDVVVVP